MENKVEAIKRLKMTTKVSDLCSDIDDGFRELLTYCRNLGFADYPDYERFRQVFRNILKAHNFK